ncbi:hypothetical protein V6Z12_D11G220400 [Gossypium hirsutum]
MQYHALSLSSIQWQKHSHSFPKILHPVMLLLKPIIQFVILLWFLCFKVPPPNAFIVQNPFDGICLSKSLMYYHGVSNF